MLKIAQESHQKLLFPQEIEVWVVLPAIRKAFAIGLINTGLSQKKVAQMLGITEAAVSQYKSNKRAQETNITKEIADEVKHSIPKIIETPQILFQEMMRVSNFIKSSGLFCRIHRSKSSTPDGCEKLCAYGSHANSTNNTNAGVHHG